MLFCNYTNECNSYSVVLLKNIICLTETKKRNSSIIFLIIVNEHLYLRVCLPFQPPLSKAIRYTSNLDACS